MKRLTRSMITVAAFGALLLGAASAPVNAAEVKQVTAGNSYGCLLTQAGMAKCWGGQPAYDLDQEPNATFKRISAGDNHACGLKRNGRAVCWGDPNINSLKAPGRWKQIEAGYYANCGVRPTGKVECFGYDAYRTGLPGGKFRSVSMGGEYACGFRPSGAIQCWGEGEEGELEPPTGEFAALTTGAEAACAQKRSGRLSCWGSNEFGLVSQIDGKIAGQTRLGYENYCAVTKGGGPLVCGGNSSQPVADPPSGRFTAVDLDAYGSHACALDPNRDVACWGENFFGALDVPRAFARPTR